MPIINNPFNGKLNLDVAEYRISNGDYIDALNITRDAQGRGQDRVVSNILGNTLIPYTLPEGTNKIIGFYPDKVRNRAYYFLWNSNGYNTILYYDMNSDEIVTVLQSKTQSKGNAKYYFNGSVSEGSYDGLNYKQLGDTNVIDSGTNFSRAADGPIVGFITDIGNPNTTSVAAGTWTFENYLSLTGDLTGAPRFYYKIYKVSGSTFTLLGTTGGVFFTTNDKKRYTTTFSFPATTLLSTDRIAIVLQASEIADRVITLYTQGDSVGVMNTNILTGIDILNFNPSYKVLSVNMFYRDLEGDILFFNDGYNPPRSLNVINRYGNDWKAEYLLVAKAPPIMPPKVVYENDDNVTVNNLRNKLFQFSYRYVYDNNEKSVWSSNSIVPLPQQPSNNLTENNLAKNSRIAVLFSTGGPDVKAIELSFRETTNGLTSDWYLIKSFDKSSLLISDNIVYDEFKFYNDAIYIQLDVTETSQLQDWVPQKANAGELANGNVLLYAGITEGYDKTTMNLNVDLDLDPYSYFYDQAGLLLLATVNGTDSGTGNLMNIYLYGTGTNGIDGEVVELNNASGEYYINSFAANGTDLSISYTTSGLTSLYLVSDILSGISAAMVLKGYTQVGSIDGNKLTMTYSDGFVLTSVGFKTFPLIDNDNTRFASVWDSGYQYAIQYFDAQGRTIGAQTSIDATINTPSFTYVPDELLASFPQISLNILNRPPLYATYYQVLRSNNTTYNKRLCWVSESAYAGIADNLTNARYLYIGIGNISAYNESISSTQDVVSYNYTDGDRIRFVSRYNVANEKTYYNPQYDYEIVGTVSTVDYNIDWVIPFFTDNNVYTANGNFLKIRYPDTDISGDFRFPGTANFQHYEILLYNYSTNANSSQRFYYEFGKEYGIGNPGTDYRYHMGLQQTQSSTDPEGVPAIIPVTNGDLFYRIRTVPFSDNYNYTSDLFSVRTDDGSTRAESFPIEVLGTVDNVSYRIQSEENLVMDTTGGGDPVWSTDGAFFYNKSSSSQLVLSIKGTLQMVVSGNCTFSLYALILTSPSATDLKYTVSLLPIEVNSLVSSISNYSVTFDVDKRFAVPPTGKLWLVAKQTDDGVGFTNIDISPFNFDFNVLKDSDIQIIEKSFSDNYNLITNSNGRPSVIDVNAQKTYFPTVIRFGQAYQSNTNLNATNRFFYEDFDEYDRTFGDVMRLHVRDRYLKVYQKFKVGNVPILTQIVKDVTGNPLQANSNQLINKIQYYSGDYGIGDAATSLAWNNFSDYFVDNYRGVVCRLSQDGITPISILYNTNAFFVPLLQEYRQELNNGVPATDQVYTGNPCIYGVFDAYTNKYIIAMEEINRYETSGEISLNVYVGGSTDQVCYGPPVVSAHVLTTNVGATSLCDATMLYGDAAFASYMQASGWLDGTNVPVLVVGTTTTRTGFLQNNQTEIAFIGTVCGSCP